VEDNIRWTVIVSKSTDRTLRSHLAQKGVKKGDLSKYIEAAVLAAVHAEQLAARSL
jgi:Ribbon-helix-helix domain